MSVFCPVASLTSYISVPTHPDMTTVPMEPVGVLAETGANATDSPLSSHEDTAATFTIGTILSIMCLVGVSGNSYTLAVMCRSMRTAASMNIYIINLALADLLYLLTIPFVVCTHFLKGWHFGDAGCRILISIDFLTMHASIFTLTVMSTERYFAVLKPLDAVKRSKSYRKAIALLVWAASLILTLPMIVSIQLMTVDKKAMCRPTLSPLSYKVYISFLFCTSIVAPGLIIGYLYMQLARTYWISQTETFKQTKKPHNQKVSASRDGAFQGLRVFLLQARSLSHSSCWGFTAHLQRFLQYKYVHVCVQLQKPAIRWQTTFFLNPAQTMAAKINHFLIWHFQDVLRFRL